MVAPTQADWTRAKSWRTVCATVAFAVVAPGQAIMAQASAGGDTLFANPTPVTLTLITDLEALLHDRTGKAPYRDALVVVRRPDAGVDSIPARVRTGGIYRRSLGHCDMPPLHLHVDKDAAKGSLFAHHHRVKITTHCRTSDRFAEYVREEYTLYLAYNILTPLSFRARFAHLTYVDRAGGHHPITGDGFLIEDAASVAHRNGSVLLEVPGAQYADLEPSQLDLATWFEYYIGNTDWSIPVLHNMVLVRDTVMGRVYPVPYDFDFSGAIGAPFAAPDPRLGIGSVTERIYRGRCGTPEEFQPTLDRFVSARDTLRALYGAGSGISASRRQQIERYNDEFYGTIADREKLKREIERRCK